MSHDKKAVPPPQSPSPRWPLAALLWLAGLALYHAVLCSRFYKLTPEVYLAGMAEELALGRHLLSFWVRHLLVTLGCVSLFAGFWALGDWLLARLGAGAPQGPSTPEDSGPHPTAAIGLGMGLWANLAFLILAARLARPWCFLVLAGGLCVFGWVRAIPRLRAGAAASLRGLAEALRADVPSLALFWCAAAACAFGFIGTTVPEISFDALVYHLAVPQNYLYAGGLEDMPFNHFARLPLLVSMVFLWGLAAAGMYGAKVINFLIGATLVWGIYAWGKEIKDRSLGIAAAALFVCAPLVLYLFWVVNADLGAALFHLLALACFARWLRRPEARRELWLAGLFGGFSLASKYTGAFGLALLAGACGVTCWRRRRELGLAPAALFVLLLILPLLPWWARNAAQTGNPFYPYLIEVLGGRNGVPERMREWTIETRGNSPGFRPDKHALKLWSDATRGYVEAPFHFTGPAFLGTLPFVFALGGAPWAAWAGAYAGVSLLAGLSGTYITRVLLLYFVPLSLVLAEGFLAAIRRSSFRGACGVLLAVCLGANLWLVSGVFALSHMEGLNVATGRMTAAGYLTRGRDLYPAPSFDSYEQMRKLPLGPGERILVVGETRAYYAPGLAMASATTNIPAMFAWSKQAKTPEELLEKLIAERVRIVLYNPHENKRTVSKEYQDPAIITRIVDMLEKHFDNTYRGRWSRVYYRRHPGEPSLEPAYEN